MEFKIYKCKTCGKMMAMIKETDVPTMCCGAPMELMQSGVTEGAGEKHIPDVDVDGNKLSVRIGTVTHPMQEDHHIEWIAVETDKGFAIKELNPTGEPKAEFTLSNGDELKAVYEHCNLHGLWKAIN